MDAIQNEEVILDLYILHRFKVMPDGSPPTNLYRAQKRFLVLAESILGQNFEGILERARDILALETLKSSNPRDTLPEGMAETLLAAGLDPDIEAEVSYKKRIEELNERLKK